jgi:hypothetical protein
MEVISSKSVSLADALAYKFGYDSVEAYREETQKKFPYLRVDYSANQTIACYSSMYVIS